MGKALICAAFFISLLNSIPSSAGTAVTPSTTLSAESGNNTSTADSFQGTNNGNAAAGNVSKVSIRSLLYSNSNTRIYAHFMPWFGGANHANVGYSSNNAPQVKKQVDDMMSRGIQGAIIDWYGQVGHTEDATTALMKAEAESRGGQFQFAVMEDAGALQGTSDVTSLLISDLIYAYQKYEQSPAYIRVNGRPVVFYFGVESMPVDWTRVRNSIPGNPLFIFENAGSFNMSAADGAFSWVGINGNTSDWGQSYLDYFYQMAATQPAKLTFGSAKKGFNDGLAAWGSHRVVSQNCGQTWLSTMQEAGKYYSANSQLPFMQLVTWNDYEEGTAIETGIDNCVSISGSASGNALSWNVSGNENTIDHYTVFISNDGQNLMPVADVPSGTHSLDLGAYAFAPNFYNVYVKAVGKASMRNQMSGVIGFTATAPVTSSSPTLSVSATPSVVSLAAGQSTTLNVFVTEGSASTPVSLSCNGPAGLSCQFDQSSVIPGASGAQAKLTLTAAPVTASVRSDASPIVWAFLLPGVSFGFVTLGGRKISKKSSLLMLLLIGLTAMQLIGCGGAGGSTSSAAASTATSSSNAASTQSSSTNNSSTANDTSTNSSATNGSSATNNSSSTTNSSTNSSSSSSDTTSNTPKITSYNLTITASTGSLQSSTVAVVTVQ